MKKLHQALSLFALAFTALAPAQVRLPAQTALPRLWARPETYDGLMIATALGPPVSHPLPTIPYFAAQRFRVDDSRAFPKGTLVDVYFETVGGRNADAPKAGVLIDPKGSVPVGARVLLAARKPQRGALLRADFLTDNPPELDALPLDGPSGNVALGEAFFPTTQAWLAADPDPKWRLLGSLAAAIPHTGDANARAIAEQLSLFAAVHDAYPYGGPDDRFSKTFADAVASDTPYHRALVDYALNGMRYLGYEGRYRRDVLLAAEEPEAFPDGLPARLEFEENTDPIYTSTWPKDYKPSPPLTRADVLETLKHAKSPTIAAWLLKGMPKPPDEDVRALARFLDSPDPRLRRAMVERLASWGGFAPPEEPQPTTDENGDRRWKYPGLDEAVTFWKRKLATPSR